MQEPSKIGVVYRDQTGTPPALLHDGFVRPEDWQIEYFEAKKVLGGPVVPRTDFLLVFCPTESEPEDLPQRVGNVFPGAEIVAYGSPNGSNESVDLPLAPREARRIVDQCASLQEGRRQLSAARRRVDEQEELFEALVELVEWAWQAADLKSGIAPILQKLVRRIGADECALYVVEHETSRLERAYSTGTIRDVELFEDHANTALLERAFQGGTVVIDNSCAFEFHIPFSNETVLVQSVLCFPLEWKGEKVGILEVLNKSGRPPFGAENEDLVRRIASPLALGLKNAQMFESSHRLTVTDDLTKLHNYRFLMQFLDTEIKRCLRYQKKVSILFIDIDGFKKINDTFGHLVGSQALAEMGQVFRNILRETDVAGRYGGDEFVVVLPETPLAGALLIAERIRKRVEDYEFSGHKLKIRLTVSMGVASCPEHAVTAEGLIKKADAAMYRAKDISRNSVEVAL